MKLLGPAPPEKPDNRWITVYESWYRKPNGDQAVTVVRHVYIWKDGQKITLSWDEMPEAPFVILDFSDFPIPKEAI